MVMVVVLVVVMVGYVLSPLWQCVHTLCPGRDEAVRACQRPALAFPPDSSQRAHAPVGSSSSLPPLPPPHPPFLPPSPPFSPFPPSLAFPPALPYTPYAAFMKLKHCSTVFLESKAVWFR